MCLELFPDRSLPTATLARSERPVAKAEFRNGLICSADAPRFCRALFALPNSVHIPYEVTQMSSVRGLCRHRSGYSSSLCLRLRLQGVRQGLLYVFGLFLRQLLGEVPVFLQLRWPLELPIINHPVGASSPNDKP